MAIEIVVIVLGVIAAFLRMEMLEKLLIRGVILLKPQVKLHPYK